MWFLRMQHIGVFHCGTFHYLISGTLLLLQFHFLCNLTKLQVPHPRKDAFFETVNA